MYLFVRESNVDCSLESAEDVLGEDVPPCATVALSSDTTDECLDCAV